MNGASAGADPRHRVLFEPVAIGPVIAPNRFYQTPYATGFGFRDPSASAGFREIRAEGGWGVVSTEQTEIHPSTDMTPFVEGRLWNAADAARQIETVEAIHKHGALAALELSHGGLNVMNAVTREDPLGPSSLPLSLTFPTLLEPSQCRQMSLPDIQVLRRWHSEAALRGVQAGFDIIYVYASLVLSLPAQFLSPRYNQRTDAYGGSLVNRARLLRELIDDTKAVVGDRAAVAVRLTLDELLESPLDGRSELDEFFGLMGELPDLWDIVIGGYGNEAGTGQFNSGQALPAILKRVKRLTTKPILSVGCFTSPDLMADLVESGALDLIGAARPSIADPFLPMKIASQRSDEIVPCIACNLCIASDFTGAPVQCPQNPTAGEEYRKGWHPQRIQRSGPIRRYLVVGSGPAGLECSRVLSEAGHEVFVHEQKGVPGGRVNLESLLPGMERVRDVVSWRYEALAAKSNVQIAFNSNVDVDAVPRNGAERVILATGSRWRRDGIGHSRHFPVNVEPNADFWTPDDVVGFIHGNRQLWPRQVTVYDDEHYQIGSLLAEYLLSRNVNVTLVTPAAEVAVWTHKTMEQRFIQRQLMDHGAVIVPHSVINAVGPFHGDFENVFTGESRRIDHEACILVTSRHPEHRLYDALARYYPELPVDLVGDASTPGTLATATYSAHRLARSLI